MTIRKVGGYGGGLYLPLTGGTLSGGLTVAQATANTSVLTLSGLSLTGANAQPLANITGTWNTSGTPTAIDMDITDTASNTASRFFRLKLSTVDKFVIDKFGNVTGPGSNAVLRGWGVFGLSDGISAPGATVGTAKLYVDTADGDLKVIFGDGVIKTLAVDT